MQTQGEHENCTLKGPSPEFNLEHSWCAATVLTITQTQQTPQITHKSMIQNTVLSRVKEKERTFIFFIRSFGHCL